MRLCEVCAPDGRVVAAVAAALRAADQPPLGTTVPAGSPLHKVRARGLGAQARLDARRRAGKDTTSAGAKKQSASTVRRIPAPRTPRRMTEQDKPAGLSQLLERITRIERQLRRGDALRPHARARLEEELAAARWLLRRWGETH